MPDNDLTQFPGRIDTFEAVENGETVYASHINKIARATTKIQEAAKSVVLAEIAAQTDGLAGGATRRREIVMDTVLVDQATSGRAYVDVQVTLKDNNGNPLPGEPWVDTDIAIHLDVVATDSGPYMPPVLLGPYSQATHNAPYNWAVISVSGPTATVRVYTRTRDFELPPRMLATTPDGKYLYVLCGNTCQQLMVYVFDAAGTFVRKMTLQSIINADSTRPVYENFRSFALWPLDIGDGYEMFILQRPLRTEDRGRLHIYHDNGTVAAIDAAETFWAQGMDGFKCDAHSLAISANGAIHVARYHGTWVDSVDAYNRGGSLLGRETFDEAWNGYFQYRTIRALACPVASTMGPMVFAGIACRYENSGGRDYTHMHIGWWKHWAGTSSVANTGTDPYNNYIDGQDQRDQLYARAFSFAQMTASPAGRTYWIDDRVVPIGNSDSIGTYYINTHWECDATENQPVIRTAPYMEPVDVSIAQDPLGRPFTFASNRPTGIAVMPNGTLYIATTGSPTEVLAFTDHTGAHAAPSLKPADPRIQCAILVTVATAANPQATVRLPYSGNLAPNGHFDSVDPGDIGRFIVAATTDPTRVLLRNKPANWGAACIEADEWDETIATDMTALQVNEQGITEVATGTGYVTVSQGPAFVTAPASCLYIPMIWAGKNAGRNLHDEMDYLCASGRTTDVIAKVTERTVVMSATKNVMVCEADLPRPQESGDWIGLYFKYWLHLLYRRQAQLYDDRFGAGYVWIQFLTGAGAPLQALDGNGIPQVRADGSPLYRFDHRISWFDNSPANAGSAVPSCAEPSNTYACINAQTCGVGLVVPTGAESVRVGLLTAATSRVRDDNVLGRVGESGGMFIDDVSIVLGNSSYA